jgi:NAD(P) transhydrogenase
VWTIPELSMVGETEESLRAQRWGLLKLVFSLPEAHLLGAHMIGENACGLIASGLVGMTTGPPIATFIDTCFNYPSLSDMYKYATYDAMGTLQCRAATGRDQPGMPHPPHARDKSHLRSPHSPLFGDTT